MTSSPTPDHPARSEPRKDLVERAAPLLPTGSEIRQVFICQTAPNFGFFLITYLTGLTIFWNKYRCVAVTQDAIYVLESSKLSGGARPQQLLDTLPRHTQLGPVSGRWGRVNILGKRHWIHKRFHEAIAAADCEAGFTH
ncbi:hypothetical protein [Nocardia sp. NPDC057440]|uniref:hypothetical protein n=1 Tax=Nocardia sp. NPDC057440 TaxID=3346134 RepID=UPI00366E7366